MIIEGTGFGNGATVTFGGTAATSVVVVNQNKITCLTPAHTHGLVDVVVTNADGTTATLTNGFTYVEPVFDYSGTPSTLTPSDTTLGPPTIPATTTTAKVAGLDVVVEHTPDLYNVYPDEALIDGSDPTGADGSNIPLRVSLSGYFFMAGATVTFGGVAAQGVIVVNSKTISCIVPAHAVGDVDVAVTNPNTSSGITRTVTLAGGFTYIAPNPVVLQLTVTEGSTAGGTAVTVSGKYFASGATVAFGGLYATSVTVVSDQVITCVTPAHTKGLVSVRVTVP